MLMIDDTTTKVTGDFATVMGQLESLSIRVLEAVSESSGIPVHKIRKELNKQIKKGLENDERNN